MKIGLLTRLINDYGTYSRVTIRKYNNGDCVLWYDGRPDGISERVEKMTVLSFTVRDIGWLEIFATERGRSSTERSREDV